MMYDQNLPLSLWAKVVGTAIYIQNRCPHKAIEAKTPEKFSPELSPQLIT
jgi:hypothetical protein